MTLPAPEVVKSAKQIYNHLDLRDRIPTLTKIPAKNASPEIQKMQTLFSTDKSELSKVIRQFLQWSPPKGQKKSINDLVSRLDNAIDDLCSIMMDDDSIIPPTKTTASSSSSLGKRAVEVEETSIANNNNNNKRIRPGSISSPAGSIITPPLSPFENTDPLDNYSNTNGKFNILYTPPRGIKCFTGVSWTIQFEIARFMTSFKTQELTFEILQRFLDVAKAEPRNLFQSMVEWYGGKIGSSTATTYGVMERCSDHVWTHCEKMEKQQQHQQNHSVLQHQESETSYSSKKYLKALNSNNRMLHYSGVIDLVQGRPPQVQLRPPKVAASNRFFRKFGDGRFMELKLSRTTHPSMIRKQKDYFLKPFLLMGRTFRFLFIKDDKVVLFATEGKDLDELITIRQVIDWHIPILDNWEMTISKFASRMTLGYSNSISTITFEPEQIEYIDDIYSDEAVGQEETCMTDGCGLISVSAMRKMMGCEQTDTLPCAVQGRIGGAKGIWIVDPELDFNSGDWIKIRQSQHKFKTGVLQYNMEVDPLHYTFDLVKNSICIYPSSLNTQFIQCLSSGGVPTTVFVDLLNEYLQRLTTVVTENRNIRLLREWIGKTGCIMRSRWEMEDTEKDLWREQQSTDQDDYLEGIMNEEDATDQNNNQITTYKAAESDYWRINAYSGLPAALHESTVRLLDSGFDLSNPHVAMKVTHVFRDVMKAVCTKYKIEVEQSCTVTCIPDPTGVLEPGEVFLQLSGRRVDEKTGIPAGLVTGDLIVTRNPCGLKSDIQKVKAVDKSELRIYTDVIVFSVKGKRSLASYLGGGDYDGDIVFCCWDERIVNPFVSSEMPNEPEQMKTVFEKNDTRVRQELVKTQDVSIQEQILQKHFISVTVPDGTLGLYENWRTVLSETIGLDTPDVIYLSHMCAKLVDAPKQGLALKQNVLRQDRNSFGRIPYPKWFQDKRNKQRERDFKSYQEVNQDVTLRDAPLGTAMDHLYDTLLEKTDAFTRYTRSMFDEDDISYKDPDLAAPWENALEAAKTEPEFKSDLDKIKKYIDYLFDEYTEAVKELVLQRQRKTDSRFDPSRQAEPFLADHNQYNTLFELEEYYAREFLANPNNTLSSSIFRIDKHIHNEQMLNAVKSSYAYERTVKNEKYSKFCYIVAYDQLRRLKADARSKATTKTSNGYSESIAPYMYTAMNLDRSWIKKIKESKSAADCGTAQVRLSIDSHLSAVLNDKNKLHDST
ncbi:RNA dependent RNA polymerase-domain-containing protein [Circinella umbellata]|nr:RNA dependent RNA polymerase-domain-containing protein [Circinella umbellata]